VKTTPSIDPLAKYLPVYRGLGISFELEPANENEPRTTTPTAKAVEKKNKSRFRLLSADEVAKTVNEGCAVHGLLPPSGIVSIFGSSGSAKTFLCLHLGAKLSSAESWFGRLIPRKHRVVYVALEGQWGMPLRLRAWEKVYEQPFPEGVRFVFEPLTINDPAAVTEFANFLNQAGGADVVFVDTLNRAAPGSDENRSSDMGKIIEGANLLQRLTKCLVILVHHSGKDESRGLRGHSSLYAALDTVIEVKRDQKNNRWWRLEKAKDGEDGISHAFDLEVAELGVDSYGLPLTSVAIRELEGPVPASQKQPVLGKNQTAVLVQFKTMYVEQQLHGSSGSGEAVFGGFGYDECVTRCRDVISSQDSRHKTERAKEALNSLIKSGHIVKVGEMLTLPD